MRTINARAMIEGAILAALTAIMGFFYNVPIVGAVTVFWSVPIIIVGYRNGFRVSLIAAFIAAVLVSLVVTPIVGLILFVTYAIPGAVMGYMIRKQVSVYRILVLCGLMLTITIVLEFILGLQLILGINIIDILGNLKEAMLSYSSLVNKQIAEVASMYRKFGFDEATINQVINKTNTYTKQIVLLLPASLVAAGMTLSYFNYKVVGLILGRIGYKIEDVHKFSEWHLSKKYRYVVIGITFIVLMLMTTKNQQLYAIYTNIWYILQVTYAILGLSVIIYFKRMLGEKYEIAQVVQNLMIVFVLLFMFSALPYIGMFDVAADIRRFYSDIPGGTR
jgi:uncharacterized protein YybS (DUF2232 family)